MSLRLRNEIREAPDSPLDGIVALFLVGVLSGGAAVLWGLDLYQDLNQPLYPVGGTVRFDGEAPVGAEVRIHPLLTTPSKKPAATGLVNEHGEFELKTRSLAAGAAEGEYAVTIQWRPLTVSGEDFLPGDNVLPPHYADPARTPLRVRVAAAENNLSPIDIHRCECQTLARQESFVCVRTVPRNQESEP